VHVIAIHAKARSVFSELSEGTVIGPDLRSDRNYCKIDIGPDRND